MHVLQKCTVPKKKCDCVGYMICSHRSTSFARSLRGNSVWRLKENLYKMYKIPVSKARLTNIELFYSLLPKFCSPKCICMCNCPPYTMWSQPSGGQKMDFFLSFPLCVDLLNKLSFSPAEHTIHVAPKEDTAYIPVSRILAKFLNADWAGQLAVCDSLIHPP